MPRRLVVAAVALAAVFFIPSVAQAATIHQDGRTPHHLLFQADQGEANLVSVEGSHGVVIRDDGGAPIKIAGVPTCMPIDAWAVSCAAVRSLELDLGDGPDVANISTPHPVEIEGGTGPDTYHATAGNWVSRVDFDGGIGQDRANYFYATAGVNVGIDLLAGDGRPGDQDRIRRHVETVIGSGFDDVLSGSKEAESLRGSDGDDQITGGAGADVLFGGDGNDRIEARDGEADAIDCGGWLQDHAAVDLGIDTVISRCATVVG
jgi:Ca2+-binding RTX toxin-like protein